MSRVWTVLAILAAFLLAAPVIEFGTSGSMQVFVAVGNAEGGGGGY